MGGQAPIPTETQSIQAYNPNALDWANFALKQQMQGLQMQYYTPLLKDTMEKRKLFKGVMKGDTDSLRQFTGMPAGATREQILDRINAYRGQGNPQVMQPNPQMPPKTQSKAKGGIMQLKGYAPGGKTEGKGLNQDQAAFVQKMGKLAGSGTELTPAQQKRLNTIETKTGRDVSPYTNTGTITPTNKGVGKAATSLQTAYGKQGGGSGTTAPTPNPYNPHEATQPPTYGVIGGPNPSDPIQFTNPWVNNALDYYNNMQAPSEWGQAGSIYGTAAQGLQSLAGYTPQQVSAQSASAQQAAAERGAAERATAAQMAAIKDIDADKINLDDYKILAAQMKQPADVTAREIQAQYIKGSQMQRPEDVVAQQLQRYQMDPTAQVSTKDLEAYQMEGPGSWTDEGVSSKYMSPYMQGVIDISKREAERDYTKQMNELAAKAKSAGAFGGSRQALERAEAQRNYNQQLQDIQVKGLQQAYESGRSQYGQELSLSQQAALQNLQSKLGTQSQSSQQALQAMLANQNIDYQTKLQNLQASLGVQSQEAQQMLNAALANQQAGLTTNQQNLQAEMQKQLANQQSSMTSQQANQEAFLRAALANQQTAFGTGQTNAQLAQQAALANQGIGVQGDLANQEATLRAYLANQQTQFGVGSLNANLANQVALQNAALGTQASLQNAQMGTNVSMQNAQLGTQASLANAQNALQAGIANQQAGLQGNAQNIGAYSAMGNMAQGLGALGNSQAGWQQQQFGNAANIANWTQQLGQNLWNNRYAGQGNAYNNSQMPPGMAATS